jgi:proteic killer suppression protein
VTLYNRRMIASWRQRGLKELWETGASKHIQPALQARIRVRLSALAHARDLAELNQPGFDFHKLRGKPERYSIHVNGPWCLVFRWETGAAHAVDLVQYH